MTLSKEKQHDGIWTIIIYFGAKIGWKIQVSVSFTHNTTNNNNNDCSQQPVKVFLHF